MDRRSVLRFLLVALLSFSTLVSADAYNWTEVATTESTQNWAGIASSSDGTKLAAPVYGGNIWTSTDSGANWTYTASTQNWFRITSSSDGTKLAATVRPGNIWTSTDSGANWNPKASAQDWFGIASSSDGTKLAAVVRSGNIWTSTDSGENWNPKASAQDWFGIASSSDGIKLAATVRSGNIWTSTDSGENWNPKASAQDWLGITSSSDGTKLAAVVWGGNIWTSTDSGANWTSTASTQDWKFITSSSDGTKLAAPVWGGNIWTSTDSGASWTSTASTQDWKFITSSSDGTKLAATVSHGYIWTSYDRPCDTSAEPENGGVGDCPSSLPSGSSCQPTCDEGYIVSGVSSCSLGTLTTATCDPAPCDTSEIGLHCSSLFVDMTADDYPSEIAWKVLGPSGRDVPDGDGGSSSKTVTLCEDGDHQFVISDEADDGICCGYGIGYYSLHLDGVLVHDSDGEYGSGETVDFNVEAPENGGVGDCPSSLPSGSSCQPTCDEGYIVSGVSSCSLGTLTTATCDPAPCDTSAEPENGGVGDCPSSLPSGSSCQPTCDEGYIVSGVSSCSLGTLTTATCDPAPCDTSEIGLHCSSLFVDMTADDYPSEIAWKVLGPSGRDVPDGDGGSSSKTVTLCEDGDHQFVISDEADDGICCEYGIGYYSLHLDGVLVHDSDGEYGSGETVDFNVEAPENGGVGDCPSSLPSGSSCQPTCDEGYIVSGVSSCSLGTLTAATCRELTCCENTFVKFGFGVKHTYEEL